jgi:hypothetical protein
MARRILNRKDLRADFEAAERRKGDEEEVEAGEEEEEDEEGDEEEVSEDEGGDEDDEEAPKPKKKKAPAKEAKPKRVRTPKVVRQKAVWVVFDNSNKRIATYEYPKEKEARDHAAKLQADKRTTHFVQLLKEPMEEKKD